MKEASIDDTPESMTDAVTIHPAKIKLAANNLIVIYFKCNWSCQYQNWDKIDLFK